MKSNTNGHKAIDTTLIEGYLARWPHDATKRIEKQNEERVFTGTPNLDRPEVFNFISDFALFVSDHITKNPELTKAISTEQLLAFCWNTFMRNRL